MNAKPPIRLPFAITSAAGRKLAAGVVFVTDSKLPRNPRRRVAGAPGPLIVERRQWASLLRQWRNSPMTPFDRRNSPTVADVLSMVIRRGIAMEAPEAGEDSGG